MRAFIDTHACSIIRPTFPNVQDASFKFHTWLNNRFSHYEPLIQLTEDIDDRFLSPGDQEVVGRLRHYKNQLVVLVPINEQLVRAIQYLHSNDFRDPGVRRFELLPTRIT